MNKVKYKCSVKTQTTALKAPTHAGLGAFKVRKFSVRKESLPSRLNTAFQEVAGHPLTLSKKTSPKYEHLSFYRYVQIPSERVPKLHHQLFREWSELGVKGRIYLAQEGINAQIGVPSQNLKIFGRVVDNIDEFKGLSKNFNYYLDNNSAAFSALHIRIRDQIVSADAPIHGGHDKVMNSSDAGYLSAEEWNQLMVDPTSIVIDVRNRYESEIGHFEGAVLPDVNTYKESWSVIEDLLQNKQDHKVMLYCTGGIRCVRLSQHLKDKGFKDVFQLKGGIVSYARQVKEKSLESKFKGKNFRFDDALAERVTSDVVSKCHQCGAPSDALINCANQSCHVLFIQCETCASVYQRTCSQKCKEVMQLSPEEYKKYLKTAPKIPHDQRVRPNITPIKTPNQQTNDQ